MGIKKEEGMVVVQEESDAMTLDVFRCLALYHMRLTWVKRSTTHRWSRFPVYIGTT
jgi:hypothetical protein